MSLFVSLAADKSVAVYDTADEFYAVLAHKKADKFAIMGNPEVANSIAECAAHSPTCA